MHRIALLLLSLTLLGGCTVQRVEPQPPPTATARTAPTPKPEPIAASPQPETKAEPGYLAQGQASYYALRSNGRRTASGERLDNRGFTAAHRELPFGTRVKVTNLANERSVVVRITDRGPHGRGRLIDLTQAAARQLDMLRAGVAQVRVESLDD
ncbi:septal ring lytic transglycosylase RlpA family protein [Pseudomonas sp. CAU 1711]|uniref:septal ring lytic transglycosylase RlpA family protein n=1 Tax=Pseudomonas sp. CAU 1711 TaxID=3140356 RepID=UPI00325FE2CA